MHIYAAEKTVKAIDAAIKGDQGAKFRQLLAQVLPHIGDAYRGEDSPFRSHLGASLIGDECPRKLWYGFRWAYAKGFDGRLLRLFNRGHLEEGRFIAGLLTIGAQVYQQDENGDQFRVSEYGGHFGGSGDGVAIGIPDLEPGQPCLLEFKTHNDKSFKVLQANGVREAKFEHYVQMQIYMRKMGLAVALYLAVNKNDDTLYGELVPLNVELADQFIDRAGKIIFAETAPKRISESPGWYKCAWCDFKKICHNKATPARNCRTCLHSRPRDDGQWYCTHPERGAALGGNVPLDKDAQLAACELWVKHEAFD